MPDINDEQYKKATKPLLDDAMRTDTLGPHFNNVLRDHKPTNDQLNKIIADAIKNNALVKKYLKEFVREYDTNRKGVWVDRVMWLIIGAGIVGGITLLVNLID